MTAARRSLGVENAAAGAYPLRIAGTQLVAKTGAVPMFDAAFKQIADDLDARMRVRLVTDAAHAVVAVVIEEHEWTDGIAVGRRQATVEHHVAVIDDLFGGKD